MASNSQSAKISRAAVSGIPKAAQLIAALPAEDREGALWAAERSYRQTVRNLGYEQAALGVSRGGFYAWLIRPCSRRSRSDEEVGAKVRASFLARDRTYGARRVWHDLLAEGVSCGLHRIERLMRLQALKARPRRRRLPPDLGERQVAAVAPNVLDRTFEAPAPNRKWIADFTYVWTAEGWLYVAAVIDLFSRRVVGWSMSAEMTAHNSWPTPW